MPYIPKVGDEFHTYRTPPEVSPTATGRFAYCNNLSRPTAEQGDRFNGRWFATGKLGDAKRAEDCLWCDILSQLFHLNETEAATIVADNADTLIYCSISRDNVVSIRRPQKENVMYVERARFQMYRRPGSGPLPQGLDLPTCPELATKPGDESMWTFLRQCLMTCLWSHEKCRAAQEIGQYPRRLLELGNEGNESPRIKLIETSQNHPTGPYIALSHCWGDLQPARCVKSNIADLKRQVNSEDLSRVFQDCITTAQKFGIRYVWIDSLCIVQDNDDDWAFHAMQMDKVFEDAIFVVAAVSSKNGSVPFLGSEASNKRSLEKPHAIITQDEFESTGPIYVRSCVRENLTAASFGGPLSGRAWAWQEHVLSTRIILFTSDQVYWECIQGQGSEMMGVLTERNNAMKTRMAVEGRALATWHRAVREYSRRQLTYAKDRLPALSGVASRFQPLIDSRYVAGLWDSYRHIDLAWESAEILSVVEGPLWPVLDNQLPSWSWASILTEVTWGLLNVNFTTLTLMCTLHSIDCKPSTANLFGEVRSGAMARLHGHITRAELVADGRGLAVVKKNNLAPQIIKPDCALVETTVKVDGRDIATVRRALPSDEFTITSNSNYSEVKARKCSGTVYCLLLSVAETKGVPEDKRENDGQGVVLVLTPVASEKDTFRRIGIGRGGDDLPTNKDRAPPWLWTDFETWEEWAQFFKDAETREIKMI